MVGSGFAARVCQDLRQLTHVASNASAQKLRADRPLKGQDKRLWMEEKLFTA
jgi:hypothetical protein